MESGSLDLALHAPTAVRPEPHTVIPAAPGLPWSRAAALNRWSRAVIGVTALQALVVAIGALLSRRSGAYDLLPHALLGAGLIAVALVGMARAAERRLLHRPPKRLLLVQLVLFGLGSGAVTASTLRLESGSPASPLFASIAHAVLGLSVLVLVAWCAATAIAASSEDEA